MQCFGWECLDVFVLCLLVMIVENFQLDLVLEWVLLLVEVVVWCFVYLVLLIENFGVLECLLVFCVVSLMVVEQIVWFLILFDELFNEGCLFCFLQVVELVVELCEWLMWIFEDDFEQQMEIFCYFKLVYGLWVVVLEIVGMLLLMKVSDYLIWLVEVIFVEVFELVWWQLVQCYGWLLCVDGMLCDLDFVIVGYGKVGGLEFGYGLDFDLVFIYDGDFYCEIDGGKFIDGVQFFICLGQKIIYFFIVQMLFGIFYEVDMCLCLSGVVGLLVSLLGVFQCYQEQEVWIWEYQVLVCVWVLVGCWWVQVSFEVVCVEVLVRLCDFDVLCIEVSEMCVKMCDNLGICVIVVGIVLNVFEVMVVFDFKYDVGGIVDIEFMV